MKNLMTQYTFDLLSKELEKVNKEREKANLDIGETAGINSDWHDNAGFDLARDQASFKSKQVSDLKASLLNVVIISPRNDVSTVGIGNTVTIHLNNKEMTLTILGKNDSARKRGWISFDSPVASKIIGLKEGDEVENIKIIKIMKGNF